MRRIHWMASWLALGAAACVDVGQRGGSAASDAGKGAGSQAQALGREAPPEGEAPGKKVIVPPLKAEAAPPPSARLPDLPPEKKLIDAARTYFEGHVGRRVYVQVDKPIYQPGETIWFKAWDLRSRDLAAEGTGGGLLLELISPKGSAVIQKRVQVVEGAASNDFVVPEGVQGGEYQIRATANDGSRTERPIIVSTYEPPRIKKKLEFIRKAYGEGDEVTATIEVKRPTGEPLAKHPLNGVVWLDGETLAPVKLTTNQEGGALVRFKLPAKIERGDGLLTLMVEDGGVTESVSKRVPIVLKKLQFSFFPEGGQLVSGLPGRVYFEAKNTIGKPADVEGRVIDDHGSPVATFKTHHQGLGRIDFVPSTGRSYQAEITRPAGITERYPMPIASAEGCTLRSYDDLDGELTAVRVGVRCSEPKKVVVAGVMRENLLDAASMEAGPTADAVVYLEPKDAALARAQGIARVTLFDEALRPLAERIVFRNRRSSLAIEVQPDQPSYGPREQVALTIRTKDAKGTPVAADLAVSIVDDTVISFADDKTGHLTSRLLLESELPDKVEEPNFYFDLTEAKGALAMDLLMGTRGWRRFDWKPVLEPPPPVDLGNIGTLGSGAGGGGVGIGRGRRMKGGGAGADDLELDAMAAPEEAEGGAVPRRDVPRPAGGPPAALRPAAARAPAAAPPPPPPAAPPVLAREAAKVAEAPAAEAEEAPRGEPMADNKILGRLGKADRRQVAGDEIMAQDKDWAAAGEKKKEQAFAGWAPVRVFPAPKYTGEYSGPRTDFRETIHWDPSVRTGKDGKVIVTFYLSDAVTSFRVFSEGVGAGAAGRQETVVKSSLPFSMAVKLPTEVSAGDKLLLPLMLTNDRDRPLPLKLTQTFGELLTLTGDAKLEGGTLGASKRESLFYAVEVTGKQGKSKVSFSADAGGLKDELVREVQVVPTGFPQLISRSGTLKGEAVEAIDLGDAIEGSLSATIKLYPSPVSTLVSGLEGMLGEPSGCFEQTSSTNYPNVMIMQYLKTHDIAAPELIERVNGMMDRGYKRLVGYETKDKGYEWFGSSPPHEALSAYGLLEFIDMKRVYGGVDDEMLTRTAAYLKSRRDGQGGYKRDPKALDSFGSAAPVVTNAYITWALSEAGLTDMPQEIAAQAKLAAETKDAYLLALAASTLLNVPARKGEGVAATKRLATMQTSNGSWTSADHSITRSSGVNLHIETTSLAMLAMMKAGGFDDGVRRGVEWLTKNRSGFGQWGATQATVLALRAMTEYANASRKTHSPGSVSMRINGQDAGSVSYEAGRRDPIVFTSTGRFFTSGANKIELVGTGSEGLPYSMAIEYRAMKPATHPDVAVKLETKIERTSMKMGENVRVTATLENKTDKGQPMTLARIGVPSGLSFQTQLLKDLREKGTIAFFETRAREVILYFREMKPNEKKEIPLDLVATVPGEYKGPASSAYLYYTDDQKFWTDGLSVKITP